MNWRKRRKVLQQLLHQIRVRKYMIKRRQRRRIERQGLDYVYEMDKQLNGIYEYAENFIAFPKILKT